ncbi:lactonase family protein [Alkalinema pantanalense CENA528]|uniref:lactonase family protein n=1 Tax=Alkalinema pantanalense TaxID=1620705 RepID=UPI003D6DAF24
MKNRRTFLLSFTALIIATSASGAIAQPYNDAIGVLYTASNATDVNQVLAFQQMRDGSLKAIGTTATGGKGSGSGLGNQGGLALTRDRRLLLAVNAGSNEISVFRFNGDQPVLVNKVSSGGTRPVSIAVQNQTVYVLNAGSDDIVGFRLYSSGQLVQLPDSRRPLSGQGTAPAQVSFTPDGSFVVVTEKSTNQIATFPVIYYGNVGYLGNRISNPSVANTPFGFAFDRKGRLLVSEAVGGAPNGSSISSYNLFNNGRLKTITPAAKTNQTAACWVVVSKDGEYAYTSNTASGTLSGFKILPNGALKALNADGVTASTGTGSGPIDMIFSRNGRFLSSLNTGNGTITTFRLREGGRLVSSGSISNLPRSANGLVAR